MSYVKFLIVTLIYSLCVSVALCLLIFLFDPDKVWRGMERTVTVFTSSMLIFSIAARWIIRRNLMGRAGFLKTLLWGYLTALLLLLLPLIWRVFQFLPAMISDGYADPRLVSGLIAEAVLVYMIAGISILFLLPPYLRGLVFCLKKSRIMTTDPKADAKTFT